MTPALKNQIQTRIPTKYGEFFLHYYSNNLDDKEHLALVKSDVRGKQKVPVRIHSECFTGDVLGSNRCDCGEQLDKGLQIIGEAGIGVLIYLRQEGRGIGLFKKMQAYNLQDGGMDTVEANIHLGHLADEREYTLAALMLDNLGVGSINLITNNPKKVNAMEDFGIEVNERIPIVMECHSENRNYLQSKAKKMNHILPFPGNETLELPSSLAFIQPYLQQLDTHRNKSTGSLYVTLSYAQSMDGSISEDIYSTCALSGQDSLNLTHCLRAHHDGILIGINTVLVDDPKLTVRFHKGNDPRPVILDSRLRFPVDATLLTSSSKPPLIFTTEQAPEDKIRELQQRGAEIIAVEHTKDDHVDLVQVLEKLAAKKFCTLMVEGGAEVINQFLQKDLADYCVITIAPKLIGGLTAVKKLCNPRAIENCRFQSLGSDVIVYGSLKTPCETSAVNAS